MVYLPLIGTLDIWYVKYYGVRCDEFYRHIRLFLKKKKKYDNNSCNQYSVVPIKIIYCKRNLKNNIKCYVLFLSTVFVPRENIINDPTINSTFLVIFSFEF